VNTISVLVPVYNAAPWLQESLQSILAQTYRNFELILIDDGSNDGSAEICDTFVAGDDRVRAVHQANAGVAAARNRGVDIARGDWIAFIDADDMAHPRYLEYLMGLCLRHNCEVAQCRQMRSEQFDPVLFGVEVDDVVLYTGQQMQWGLCGRGGTRSMLWCKLFRRELFDSVRFPVGLIHEDEAAMHHLLANARRMAFSTSKFYYYRTTPDSIMNKPLSEQRLDMLPIMAERQAFYWQKGWRLLAYATAQRHCASIIDLYRRFLAQDPSLTSILQRLRNAYSEIWPFLSMSPLLNPEIRRLHEAWLDDPLQGKMYPFLSYASIFDDDTFKQLERRSDATL
jgi:glycosyltransferase involved in cell wall biosynthesis